MAEPGGTTRVDLMLRTDSTLAPQWTDVTTDVFNEGDGSITIQRGRQNESKSLTPSTCSLSFSNPAGKYSPRNPSSPYYGILGRNTPLRVGKGQPPIGNASWTGVDSTSLVAPSVTAAGAGLAVAAWAASPVGNITTPGGWTATAESDAAESTYRSAYKTVAAGAVGTATATFSVTATEQAALEVWLPGASVTVESTLGLTSGTGTDLAGTFIASYLPGDTLLAITSWQFDPAGRMCPPSLESAEPDPWMLVTDSGARDGLRMQAWVCQPTRDPGTQMRLFASNDQYGDVYMRVYVLRGVDTYRCRFVGEVAEWPQEWDLRGKKVVADVTASSVSRRLRAGGFALEQSALRRSLQSAAQLQAYWPCEDSEGSISVASAAQGGASLFSVAVATPVFAGYDDFPGSSPVATWNGAGALGAVVPYTNTGELLFGALVFMPAAGTANGANLVSVYMSTGTIRDIVLEYRTGGSLAIRITNQSGTEIVNQVSAFGIDGKQFYFTASVTQNGADVDWVMQVHYIVTGTDTATTLQFSGSGASLTLGVVNTVRLALESGNSAIISTDVAIGHVIVANQNALFSSIRKRALVGHFNEKAEDRVARACKEAAVPAYVQHNAESKRHGLDMPGALLTVLSDSEKLDLGALYEPRGHLGISYRTRDSWQSIAATATLNYAAAHISAPFVPVDDDQQTVNDVTVTRTGGSSARYTVTTGPLSVLAPPDGVGVYDSDETLNAAHDYQLLDHAAFRAHLGTWDEARWPKIQVDLAKNPSLVAAVTALDVGDVVRLTNLPAWVPPGPTDLLVTGFSETICYRPGLWTITLHCVPYSPFKVLTLVDGYNRIGSDTTTLAEDLDTTETGVNAGRGVGSAAWTNRAGDLPFDIVIGGEQMTVTHVGPDGTFESGVGDWTPTSGTLVQSSTQAHDGASSALLTVVGSPTQTFFRNAVRPDIVAGESYTVAAWIYSSPGDTVNVAIDWRTSAGTLLSTVGSIVTIPAATWTYVTTTGIAPATTALANYGATITGSPTAGDAIYVDDVTFTGPQTFTVTRSVNGVVKTHSTGATVRLAEPMFLAL